MDSAEFSAYNVAKSFYQNYPEVFNIAMIREKTHLADEDIKARIKRMYDEHLIMFVMNPAVAVYGWGLYYWVVKLKDGTDPKVKQQLSEWFQNKDDICTGYETNGDFDYFNGNHMRVLDNLLYDVIGPWKDMDEVEYVHLCPIRRDIRESHGQHVGFTRRRLPEISVGRCPEAESAALQDKMDAADFAIIDAINNCESVGDMLDYACSRS